MKLRQYWLIVILGLVAGLVGGALSGWIFFMVESKGAASADIEKIKLGVQIATLIVLIFSVLLLGTQIRKTQKWNKKRATRDMVVSYLEKAQRCYSRLYEIAKVDFNDSDQTYKTVVSEDNYEDLKIALVMLLGLFEEIAMGIRYKIYDNDLVYDLDVTIFLSVYKWAESFIVEARLDPYSETAYLEFEQLCKQWQTRYDEKMRLPHQSKSLEDDMSDV